MNFRLKGINGKLLSTRIRKAEAFAVKKAQWAIDRGETQQEAEKQACDFLEDVIKRIAEYAFAERV